MAALPDRIGRYIVDRELGRGGMGVIYKAHDPEIDRPVAIKLIRADLLSDDGREDFIARFRREAKAAGRCAHPNIVGVYDIGLDHGDPFIAMEFVEGVTLGQEIKRGTRFSIPQAVGIVQQVLAALGCAHENGVIHRDIKPANVLLQGARVKVMDFGIARLDASDLTQVGSVVGSLHYMSPEQCQGDPLDHRSDLFSAGTMLYLLLTGKLPFDGGSFTQIAYRLMNQIRPICATTSPPPRPPSPPSSAAPWRNARTTATRTPQRFQRRCSRRWRPALPRSMPPYAAPT